MTAPSASPLRLGVPRHLQDCNGYCGPACVMMVHSSSSATVEAQHEMFRRVREHARQANDRRPVKSPAESLLTLLNSRGGTWEKMFRSEPEPVAARIVQAVENAGKPCLLLISKGMHWVVAFGRTRRDDGSAAGVLLRDPAWAGMPGFFGLTTMPEKPTFLHTAGDSCPCLAADNPPGSVHERYMAVEELLSPRGLQGSPDWEGKGALALVPAEPAPAAMLPRLSPALPLTGLTLQQAAMQEAAAHGLYARTGSPPDWQEVLHGGKPGEPILVKDPDDPRDDFYLVPVQAPNAALRRTAWILLDPQTLRLREASLLDNWLPPAFPNDQDAATLAGKVITLPDGTAHRFSKAELRPNQRNLVWAASAASILPYWPVKEFTAAHPVTGEQVSLYLTQHGAVCSLSQDGEEESVRHQHRPPQAQAKRPVVPLLCLAAGVAAGWGIAALRGKPEPVADTGIRQELETKISELSKAAAEHSKSLNRERESKDSAIAEAVRTTNAKWQEELKGTTDKLRLAGEETRALKDKVIQLTEALAREVSRRAEMEKELTAKKPEAVRQPPAQSIPKATPSAPPPAEPRPVEPSNPKPAEEPPDRPRR